jgi:hypothetical protein
MLDPNSQSEDWDAYDRAMRGNSVENNAESIVYAILGHLQRRQLFPANMSIQKYYKTIDELVELTSKYL